MTPAVEDANSKFFFLLMFTFNTLERSVDDRLVSTDSLAEASQVR